jgi:hypothetical protein
MLHRACLLLIAVATAAAVEPDADGMKTWRALCDLQVEQLVAFAKADGVPKGGSFELEIKEQAIAFARRIDPKSERLKNVFPQKRAMTAEEQTADRAQRATASAQDKARSEAEAASTAEGGGPPAEARTIKDTFETLRHGILTRQVAHAAALSLDPDEPGVVELRLLILKQIQGSLAAVKWRWEKDLKERVARLLAARYEPWTGVWQTAGAWGELTLVQTGPKVSGTWAGGSLVGEAKGRSLLGAWKGKPKGGGTFTFSMGDGDTLFDAHVIIEMTQPENWNAMRKSGEPPAEPVLEPETPVAPTPPATPPAP